MKIDEDDPLPISTQAEYAPVFYPISSVNCFIPLCLQASPIPWKMAVGTAA